MTMTMKEQQFCFFLSKRSFLLSHIISFDFQAVMVMAHSVKEPLPNRVIVSRYSVALSGANVSEAERLVQAVGSWGVSCGAQNDRK